MLKHPKNEHGKKEDGEEKARGGHHDPKSKSSI